MWQRATTCQHTCDTATSDAFYEPFITTRNGQYGNAEFFYPESAALLDGADDDSADASRPHADGEHGRAARIHAGCF